MNQQDELTDLINNELEPGYDGGLSADPWAIAGVILDAGYSRPRVVESIEDSVALCNGTIIRDRMGRVFERFNGWWGRAGDPDNYADRDIALPATVLHLPEEAK